MHKKSWQRLAVMIFILFGFFTTSINSQVTQQFHEYPDTLILKTNLEKGYGLFSNGAVLLNFRDTSEYDQYDGLLDYPKVYPSFLDSIKLILISTQLYPFKFHTPRIKQGAGWREISSKDRHILCVTGLSKGDSVYIVDQNHNQDLTDDPIRKFTTMDWKGTENLIKCNYNIIIDEDSISKHGWINIGRRSDYILETAAQHYISEFSVNDNLYRIAVVDDNCTTFCVIRPKLALVSEDGKMRDTLMKWENVKKEEFVFLEDQPYKFHDFFNGCGTLVLVKEKDYESKVGIQVGLIAPDFKIRTVSGKIIDKKSLNGKPIMIVNLTGCGGPGTFKQYDEFVESFHGKYHIIALEPKINKDLPGILVDTDDEFNKDFYKKYRNAYSSYDCYYIDIKGRIRDFFSIYTWEKSMNIGSY